MKKIRFICGLLIITLLAASLCACAEVGEQPGTASAEQNSAADVSETREQSTEEKEKSAEEKSAEESIEETSSAEREKSGILEITVTEGDEPKYAVAVEGKEVFTLNERICGINDISKEKDLSVLAVYTATAIRVIDKNGTELFDASNYNSIEKGMFGSENFIVSSDFGAEKYIINRSGKILAGPYAVLCPTMLTDVYYCSETSEDGFKAVVTVIDGKKAEGVYTLDQNAIATYVPQINDALGDFADDINANGNEAFEKIWSGERYNAAVTALGGLSANPNPEDLEGADLDAYLMRGLAAHASDEWSFYEAEELLVCENGKTSFIASLGGIQAVVTVVYKNSGFSVVGLSY